MKKASRWLTALGLGAALLFSSVLAEVTQIGPSPQVEQEGIPIEARLRFLAERLRMGMTLATLAVLSPAPPAQRLHIQQVINLLEGPRGKHFIERLSPEEQSPGLVPEAQALFARLAREPIDSRMREPVRVAAKNTLFFLNLALENSLLGLRRRHMESAAEDMLKAYAYLSAALGCESDPAYLGGVLVLDRLLTSPPSTEGAKDQP